MTPCPRCKTPVEEEDLINKAGKRTWCSECRRKRVEALSNLGKRQAKGPVLQDDAATPLARLVQLAEQCGAWKYKAKVTSGARRKHAWAAYFRARKVLDRLLVELQK